MEISKNVPRGGLRISVHVAGVKKSLTWTTRVTWEGAEPARGWPERVASGRRGSSLGPAGPPQNLKKNKKKNTKKASLESNQCLLAPDRARLADQGA